LRSKNAGLNQRRIRAAGAFDFKSIESVKRLLRSKDDVIPSLYVISGRRFSQKNVESAQPSEQRRIRAAGAFDFKSIESVQCITPTEQ
jgi:hypothetical protein